MVMHRGAFYVGQPPDRVWKLLSDWGRLSEWDENCVEISAITGDNSSSILSSTKKDVHAKSRNTSSVSSASGGRGSIFKHGVGAQWECKFSINGIMRKSNNIIHAVYRCVEWERDSRHRAVFQATSSYIRTRDTLEIIQAPGGCQVSFQFELYYRNLLLAPLSFTLNGKMQRARPRIISDLKKYVYAQLLLDEEYQDHLENTPGSCTFVFTTNNDNMNKKKLIFNNISNVTNNSTSIGSNKTTNGSLSSL